MDTGLQTIKLSELPEAIILNESDYSLIVQNGTSKKIKGLLLKGNAGDNGKSIEIQKTNTHIQWRQEGGQWINLVALADLKGDKGDKGEQGTKGDKGEQGAKGAKGDNGKSIEIQKTNTHIQWRQEGGQWINLVALADLKGDKGDKGEQGTKGDKGEQGAKGAKGDNGKSIEIQKTNTHIQWRQEGGQWINLVALADLKGDKGDKGEQGTKGDKGEQGAKGAKGDKGDAGADAINPTFTIGTVTTLPSGSDTTVTLTGTYPNLVLNFGIPRGADGSGGGTGLTTEQANNIAKIPAIQSTVDALPNNYASKNHNHSEYASSSHRHDASEIDNLPSGGGGSGEGLTSEQAQQLQTAYEHSQTPHVQQSDIPTKLSKLENDSNFANQKYVDDRLIEISTSGVITEDAVDSDIFIAGVLNNTDIVTDCLEGWWTPAVKINQTLYDNSNKSRNVTYPDTVIIDNDKLTIDANGSANVEIDIEPTEILTIEYVINLTNQTNGTAIGTYYYNKSAGMRIRISSGRWFSVEVGYDSTSEGEAIDNKMTLYSNTSQTALWQPTSVGMHHILIRYNSELSRVEAFIDGQLSTAYKDLVGKKTPIFNVSKVGFNSRGIGFDDVKSINDIEIYDMKIYSKMLSDEEVTKNYNSVKYIIEGQ